MRAPEPDPGALLSVVLAAGKGRRLEPLSSARPKALLPVLDRPLVAWQLEALRAVGVREVVLVVRHLGDQLRATLGDGEASGLRIHYVEQPEPLGIAHALGCAAPWLTRPFVCLLGDVFFERADLVRLVQAFTAETDGVIGVRAGEDARAIARNFAVNLDRQGWVRAVTEKPRDGRAGVKGVGSYVFRPAFLESALCTPPSALRGERELTHALQLFLEGGARVRAVAGAGRDFNLSEPADLLAANLHALALSGRTRWIAEGAHVAEGAEVELSVVRPGARVASGARLQRVLVLDGESVGPGDYREAVFAAGVVLDCAGR